MSSLRNVLILFMACSAFALRFAIGDRVECHLGNQHWEAGAVKQQNIEQEGEVAAYLVMLDSGQQVVAPLDDNRYIKPEGAATTAISARLLRFSVGAKVECNLGMYWARGTVMSINYHQPSFGAGVTMPYQVKLDFGNVVFAPQDTDEYIRPSGTIQMRDPGLRFGVGDRVEALVTGQGGAGERQWMPGVIVVLHYHEPRFGTGVTVPYQIKLDVAGDENALIFATSDTDESVRRSRAAAAMAPAAGAQQQTAAGDRGASASPSKRSKSKVGRRASTIGLKHDGSKLGGSKLGGAAQRARARTHASAMPEPREDALARWRAATDAAGQM